MMPSGDIYLGQQWLLAAPTHYLNESMLTNHQRGLVAFTWWQFHWKCSTYLPLIWLIINQRLHQHLPQANELNWARLRLPASTMLDSHVDVDTTDVEHRFSITRCTLPLLWGAFPLTHWGRNKMAAISRRHFQMHFLEWKCLIFD